MGLIDRRAILDSDDLDRELVRVPEWGGELYIRAMRGYERDAVEASVLQRTGKDLTNVRARIVCMTAVDSEGKQLFEEGDIEKLGKKSAKVLERLFSVAQRLSGLTGADVEELEKNSKSDQGGASPSG